MTAKIEDLAEFLYQFWKHFAHFEGTRPWLGPNGFTFDFFKHFRSIIKDMIRFVEDFSVTAHIFKGCNPSFIALIPNVLDPKVVSKFRPIVLIECQYKIIGKLLANRLSLVIGECVSSEQSAFIKVKNIIDDPLILNKVMEWYQKRKRRLMIFKVDFVKAYDSLRCEFLDLVMAVTGFGFKCRRWIKGCLLNSRAFILVNRVPMDEFEICRGLCQGDLLSSFLFILAIEGLHVVILKVLQSGLFKGVGVAHEESSELASILGCGVSVLPFNYLGVPVGCNMYRLANWKGIVDKFKLKLSTWNSHTLSIGGRLALIKVVLANKESQQKDYKFIDLQLIVCGGMFMKILSQGEALKIVSFMEIVL
ncbi:putative RNA-directed DNA polymerase, eukaryota, reverse transcriptase zinc-binding domain protein [Tanacetum coccineum]